MSKIPIAAITVDTDDRLCVYPDVRANDGYTHIHRDASGVRWDFESRCLVSETPRKLTHRVRFAIIRRAVRSEYGAELVITRHTQWENVPSKTRVDIEAEIQTGAS